MVIDAGDHILQASLSTPGKKVAYRLIIRVLVTKHCNFFSRNITYYQNQRKPVLQNLSQYYSPKYPSSCKIAIALSISSFLNLSPLIFLTPSIKLLCSHDSPLALSC